MKGKSFTILIVARGGHAPRSISVCGYAVCGLLSAFVMVLFGILALGMNNQRLSATAKQMPAVLSENARLQREMSRLEGDLYALLGQMDDLKVLEREVRGIVSEVAPDELFPAEAEYAQEVPEHREDALYYLREEIPRKSGELESLLEDVAAYRDELAVTPDFWPAQGRVTSPFGWRPSPFTRRTTYHSGIDIGGNSGAPVWAAAGGKVIQARYQGGFGNYIIIDHGTYSTHYAHLRNFHIQAGDTVEKGQLIGEVGSTGYSTGPHLHFEIHKNGNPINPLDMLRSEV